MQSRDSPDRFTPWGLALQASVPGFYAWAVTVAPTVWNESEPFALRLVGLGAPIFLAAGAWCEPRVGLRARILSLWSFVIACGFVWGAAPNELAPARLDPVRGVAGMLGWALFALTWAGGQAKPPGPSRSVESRGWLGDSNGGPPRGRSSADSAWVIAGVLAAAAMQFAGWQVTGPETALFVRFVTVAGGLATLAIATNLAVGRRVAGTVGPSGSRSQHVLLPLLVLITLAGVALARLLFTPRD